MGRLDLAPLDRLKTGSNGLGLVPRMIDRKGNQHGREGGRQRDATLVVEALEGRDIPIERCAGRQMDRQWNSKQEAERRPEDRDAMTGRFLAAACPTVQNDDRDDGSDAGDGRGPEQRTRDRPGQEQPPIVHECDVQVEKVYAPPDLRQAIEADPMPEHQVHQDRRIADEFDVDKGEPRDQPVGRQPCNADDQSHDRAGDDDKEGDEKGVEDADQVDPAIAVRAKTVVQQREVDAETRCDGQKPKSGLHAAQR